MKRFNIVLPLILLINQFSYTQWVTHHNAVHQPEFAKPAVYVPYYDPSFHAKVTRITDASASSCAGNFPQYSKRQAWNFDGSRLLILSADGRTFLYDGLTYQYIRELPGLGGEDVFWHHSDPNLVIFVPDNVIRSYNILNDEVTEIHAFPQYSWINTRGEGNLSRDGRYYAFAGQIYDSTTHYAALAVYDFQTNSVISSMPLPATLESFDWVSISPLGNYVVVDYATTDTGRFRGVEVYDRNFNFLWQKPLGFGHSDLTVDASGNEALVMDYYDENTNSTFIKKIILSTGIVINLIEYSWSFNSHISCRNEERAEWCFISTYDGEGRLTHDSLSWLPFEDEIFALKLDGSGEVQRIAHHHSRRFSPATPDGDNSVYWAEPHATVNRQGTRLLYGSNWSQHVESDTSVDAYIADISELLDSKEETGVPGGYFLYNTYPNPFNAAAVISFSMPLTSRVIIMIYDLMGQQVQKLTDEEKTAGIHKITWNAANLPGGVYFCQLRAGSFVQTRKMVLLK